MEERPGIVSSLKLRYPTVLPVAGGIISGGMGVGYYIGVMISQLFIGRPSSTWILGIFWLPFFLIKPILGGILIGAIAWLIIRFFCQPHPLTPSEIRTFKKMFILLMILSAVVGVLKITMAN